MVSTELSGAEVARRLNINPSTVSKAVLKGRKPVEREALIKRLLRTSRIFQYSVSKKR